MRSTTHEIAGIALALAAARVLDASSAESVGVAAGALIGSRLPDVDQPGARAHRPSLLERRSVVVGIAGAALRLPGRVFAVLVRHRGVTHSALACALSAGAAALVAYPAGPAGLVVAAGIGLGYAAHVAADACTPGGVTLWAPLSRRRMWLLPRGLRITTGSLPEALLAAALVAALAAVLLYA